MIGELVLFALLYTLAAATVQHSDHAGRNHSRFHRHASMAESSINANPIVRHRLVMLGSPKRSRAHNLGEQKPCESSTCKPQPLGVLT